MPILISNKGSILGLNSEYYDAASVIYRLILIL
jgi:hypothetical protein